MSTRRDRITDALANYLDALAARLKADAERTWFEAYAQGVMDGREFQRRVDQDIEGAVDE